MSIKTDSRQRFFIDNSPVRGDVVMLEQTLTDIFNVAENEYPLAVKKLLGEMVTVASLLASTVKIAGRLSIQLQSSQEDACITWAMAECNHEGEVRALAKVNENMSDAEWLKMHTADDVLADLSKNSRTDSVLFINIEPEQGQRYQGIVERVSNNLAECMRHYQEQSAQLPTVLSLACNGDVAGGLLIQHLPSNSQEKIEADDDLWIRIVSLTKTISEDELLNLPAQEILYRLYHEEEVKLPETVALKFGCTCSEEKCLTALYQLGLEEVTKLYAEQDGGELAMDCHFCGKAYPITQKTALSMFKLPN